MGKKGGFTAMSDKGRLPFLFIPLRERASAPLGRLLPREGGRLRPPYSKAAFPHRHFERKREIFFVRGQGKRRGEGERETPHSLRLGSTVFHAESFTKGNGNGKRKRSLDCARDDETREGISHILFQPMAGANLRPFGAPPSRGRRECDAFPHCHFERTREIFFLCG